MHKSRFKGVFLTLLGAFCFALAPVWIRSIEAYGAVSIVFYRALIGLIPLAFWVLYSKRLREKANPFHLDWKNRLVLLGTGLSMMSTASFYYFAIMKTTVAKAVLLHYTAPIYVALLAPFLLKEKNSPLTWFAIVLGLIGTALITEPAALLNAGRGEIIGMASALLSGVCLAGVFLFGRFLSGSVPSLVRTMWGCLIVAAVLLPWGATVPSGHIGRNFLFLLTLATVSLVVPYTLFFKAQNYISAQAVSISALFEPVCGVAIGFTLYGEYLSPLGAIGAVFVMAGILISTYRA